GRGKTMASIGRSVWTRFVRIAKLYLTSDQRWRAYGLLAILLTLLLTISGLNVAISYVGRDFMTAIAARQPQPFYLLALVYVGVFAAATAAGAFARYFEYLLGLSWREWLTDHFLKLYLAGRAYFRLNAHAEVDNPDQRISEDLRTFTGTTLSFLVMAT